MSSRPMPEQGGDVPGERLVHRPGPDQRRRGEGQPRRNLADLDQARPAFLHEHLGEGGLTAGFQPRVGRCPGWGGPRRAAPGWG